MSEENSESIFGCDDDKITLCEPLVLINVVGVTGSDRKLLVDPELQQLEDRGYEYLSNDDDDDVNALFTIDGDDDKQIIK